MPGHETNKKNRCYFEALQEPTVIRRISPRFHEHAASLLAMPCSCSCSCSPRTQRLPARARTVSHAHALWQQPARNETLPRPAQQLQRRDAGCTALRSPTNGTWAFTTLAVQVQRNRSTSRAPYPRLVVRHCTVKPVSIRAGSLSNSFPCMLCRCWACISFRLQKGGARYL